MPKSRTWDEGSAIPLLALGIVIAGVAIVGLGRIGAAAADRARASTAADAAALAGTGGGEAAAGEYADRNGASMVRYERRGLDTRATVRVGSAMATGRARSTGPTDEMATPINPGAGTGVGAADGPVAPAMRAALGRAAQLLGRQVKVRSVANRGLVVDVDVDEVAPLAGVGTRAGLCPAAPEHPERFALCPPP